MLKFANERLERRGVKGKNQKKSEFLNQTSCEIAYKCAAQLHDMAEIPNGPEDVYNSGVEIIFCREQIATSDFLNELCSLC